MLIATDRLFVENFDQIVALAARHAIPVMHYLREYVAAGGLMSYGTSYSESYRQVGVYTGRILKGAKPGDLPWYNRTSLTSRSTSKRPRHWASPCHHSCSRAPTR